MTRVGYRLDGAAGVEDPRGMAAERLTADLHAVTADDAPVRNLLLVVERCHLTTAGLVAAPYAGAVAVTTAEERQLGVTAIDIGGGATTLAMFAEGHFLHTDAVAVGGHHLTIDIARALSAPLAESERIKALYGTMVEARSDECEPITYPRAGDDEEMLFTTTKAHVRSIIAPRVDSLLRLIAERMAQAPAASLATRHIVLTGGASQLVGLAEYAANVLGHPVRVARPVPVGGLPASVCGPAFSVAVGLLIAVSSGDVSITAYRDRDGLGSGYLHRVGAWLREF
jgi:cell division protein FtsA